MADEMIATKVVGSERLPPRERIIAAARELFYRHGIRAVGVEAIAEAAGTNKMTLYRHFDSKDALVAEYLRGLAAEKHSAWSTFEAEHPGDPRAQLEAWLVEAARNVSDPKSRGCALANAAVELPEKHHPARCVIEQCKQDSRAKLVALCREAGATQPELLADQLFMLLEGALVCTQSTGHQGPACNFIEAGRAIVAAHLR
ncbi:helix-turn-helix domain-containing protein [Pseudorhodoplanes sp.]|uniref:TetR/AcrR family transcriptional regulator n=1 Tax=Pseudorhodoplanes sp. TaxID=1934341 RepID=UPI002CDF2E7A|nr:helix-turn-helix domain-containing protein [Pseudorhodoplanes sp.]HWV42830.1 helix-turn-helix domain-containing protein [Pseudorhodoplanes sp.]